MGASPRLRIVFFRLSSVREWLKALPREQRKTLGEELKTVQFGWPLGMPLVRKMEPNLWEVRVNLGSTTARVLFTVEKDIMVLLHGFIKKSQKTPRQDLSVARKRLAQVKP